MKRTNLISLMLLAVSVCLCSCSPTVAYRIDAEIAPNGNCARSVIVKGVPSKKMPNSEVRLKSYLDLPDAENYDNYVLTPSQLILGGRFQNPNEIPQEFAKITIGTDKLACNRISFSTTDLVFIKVFEYEEKISDIVSREDGEKALSELMDLLLEEAENALVKIHGDKYDFTALIKYLKENLPTIASRTYSRLWEVRRAARGGASLVDENEEWGQFLVDEVRKYGLNLPPYGSENAQEESRRLVTEFIDRKLAELVAPKGEGIEPASSKLFSQMNGADGIMALMTKSIAEKYGSVQSFTARIDKLLPRVLGAFMISRFSVLPTNPDFDFRVRLRMPGGVVKTNGLRDIDGRIIWAFSERDIAISGYSMWAQSIIIDRSSLKAIGLDKFPGHLSDVEHLNRLMRTGDKGEINADIQHALRQCIMVKSLSPLASLTKADEKTEISNAPLATTTDAAKKLLGLFESFAKDKKKTMEPELDGAQPAEPELGTSSLGAPGRHSDVDPTEEEKDGEK